ncbi:MAG: adenylate/guanylate cyclase protein, partial [Ramlibacter sp.]|uniref:adenylate/guanylate cyclase domain-containing protein n=1 Tax=Ramlibacter sp. TaxID=1917967 RepID=UPI002614EF52
MLCAKCHQQNPAAARFCNQCGSALAPAAAPQLRRLTLMFCDLVGSVELASRLDPEDWHALLGAYQAAAGDAVRGHHGYVAQHLGDGLVAYFGYPLAGEDDALRAVAAAFEVVANVSALAVPRSHDKLRVRVGLHTGPAVMGQVGGNEGEYLAMGETPNIAARIQAVAPSNSIVLSAATRTLVQPRVRCVELGAFQLKGLAVPVRLFHARSMRAPDDTQRLVRGLSPFFGRTRELALLSHGWEAAAAPSGRCLLLLGQPGIGKSRLARELRARAVREDADAWTMRCSAHTATTPFAPLAQFLRQAMAAAGGGTGS